MPCPFAAEVTSVGKSEMQTPTDIDMDITPAPRGAVGGDGSSTSDLALDTRRANPGLAITWDASAYGPAPTLVQASKTAATVVVGARGLSAVQVCSWGPCRSR